VKRVRIGCGSGYLEDRLDPALEIIEKANVEYIVFEALAEATLAGMQLEKKNDPSAGYAKLTAECGMSCRFAPGLA
jgi:Acyclic terpene utilisation family protein AtuA